MATTTLPTPPPIPQKSLRATAKTNNVRDDSEADERQQKRQPSLSTMSMRLDTIGSSFCGRGSVTVARSKSPGMEPRIDTVSDLKVHENEPRTSNDADSRRETLASDDCRNVETSKNRNPVTTKADPAFVVLSPTAQEFLQAQEITSALNFTATNTKELAPAWIEWSGEGASKTNGKAMSEIQCWKREVRYQVSAAALNSQGEVPDSHAEVGFAFPGRLHKMLRGVEAQGLSHIVSWHPLGHCFVVHKQKAFVRDILHKHFNQSKITSFYKQLNVYGFLRVKSGADRGSYHHPCFLRGRPGLCRSIDRLRIKRNGSARQTSPSVSDPRFYEMTPCLESNPCTSSRVFPVEENTLNDASFLKGTEGNSLQRFVSICEDLPTQHFLKKSNPELEPEPIPFVLASVKDMMDRDVKTIDKDVLSFLANYA